MPAGRVHGSQAVVRWLMVVTGVCAIALVFATAAAAKEKVKAKHQHGTLTVTGTGRGGHDRAAARGR